MTQKIAVLIPNYNGAKFIRSTLDKFESNLYEFPVLVVDDASTDDSISVLKSSKCEIIERRINGGFAAAINTGFRYLIDNCYDVVLVANSDIEIDLLVGEEIRKSFSLFDEDSGIMVLGYCESGSFDCKINDDISGFLFALRLSMLKEVGYFDESFYMYGEEQDYFRRIMSSGYRIHQTNIRVKHVKEGSSSSSMRNSWFAMRNALYLEAKRGLWLRMMRTAIILFLMINRIYRPIGYRQDPSYDRIVRPGVLKGNYLLLKSVIWNLKTFH